MSPAVMLARICKPDHRAANDLRHSTMQPQYGVKARREVLRAAEGAGNTVRGHCLVIVFREAVLFNIGDRGDIN